MHCYVFDVLIKYIINIEVHFVGYLYTLWIRLMHERLNMLKKKKKASFSCCLCFQQGRWMKLLLGNDQWKFFCLEDSDFCEDYILMHCKITGWKPGKYVSILFLKCKLLCVCVCFLWGGVSSWKCLWLWLFSLMCHWLNLGITLPHVKDNLM